jgi:hypothetical protein
MANPKPVSHTELYKQWVPSLASPAPLDHWLVVTDIPMFLKEAELCALVATRGFHSVHLSPPLCSRALRRVGLVQYRSKSARDAALTELSQAAGKSFILNYKYLASTAADLSLRSRAVGLPGTVATAMVRSLHDYAHAPLRYAPLHEDAPGLVGLRQWRQGPIPLALFDEQQQPELTEEAFAAATAAAAAASTAPVAAGAVSPASRMMRDLAQASMLALALDTLRGVGSGSAPDGSSSTNKPDAAARAAAVAALVAAPPSLAQMQQHKWFAGASASACLRAVTRYLLEVHLYCYWSGALFQSAAQATSMVGAAYLAQADLRSRNSEPEAGAAPQADPWTGTGVWTWATAAAPAADGDGASVFASRVDAGFQRMRAWASTSRPAQTATQLREHECAQQVTALALARGCVGKERGRVQCRCGKVMVSAEALDAHLARTHPVEKAAAEDLGKAATLFHTHRQLLPALTQPQPRCMCQASAEDAPPAATCLCGFVTMPLSAYESAEGPVWLLERAVRRVWQQTAYDAAMEAQAASEGEAALPETEAVLEKSIVSYDEPVVARVPDFSVRLW